MDFFQISTHVCVCGTIGLMAIILKLIKDYFKMSQSILERQSAIFEEHNIRQNEIIKILRKLEQKEIVSIEKIQENADRLNAMMLELKGVVVMTRANLKVNEEKKVKGKK